MGTLAGRRRRIARILRRVKATTKVSGIKSSSAKCVAGRRWYLGAFARALYLRIKRAAE